VKNLDRVFKLTRQTWDTVPPMLPIVPPDPPNGTKLSVGSVIDLLDRDFDPLRLISDEERHLCQLSFFKFK